MARSGGPATGGALSHGAAAASAKTTGSTRRVETGGDSPPSGAEESSRLLREMAELGALEMSDFAELRNESAGAATGSASTGRSPSGTEGPRRRHHQLAERVAAMVMNSAGRPSGSEGLSRRHREMAERVAARLMRAEWPPSGSERPRRRHDETAGRVAAMMMNSAGRPPNSTEGLSRRHRDMPERVAAARVISGKQPPSGTEAPSHRHDELPEPVASMLMSNARELRRRSGQAQRGSSLSERPPPSSSGGAARGPGDVAGRLLAMATGGAGERRHGSGRPTFLVDLMGAGAMSGSSALSAELAQAVSQLNTADPDDQIGALSALSDVIARATESAVARSGIDIDDLARRLIELLSAGSSSMLKLLSTRVLSHLMDAVPGADRVAAAAGAIPVLCASLSSIDDIDLAEQAMKCLETLSRRHSVQVLEANGLQVALQYRDFFSSAVQLRAVTIATRACSKGCDALTNRIASAAPLIVGLFAGGDPRVTLAGLTLLEKLATNLDDSMAIALQDAGLLSALINLATSPSDARSASLCVSGALMRLNDLAKASKAVRTGLWGSGAAELLRRVIEGGGETSELPTHATNMGVDTNGASDHGEEKSNAADDFVAQRDPSILQAAVQLGGVLTGVSNLAPGSRQVTPRGGGALTRRARKRSRGASSLRLSESSSDSDESDFAAQQSRERGAAAIRSRGREREAVSCSPPKEHLVDFFSNVVPAMLRVAGTTTENSLREDSIRVAARICSMTETESFAVDMSPHTMRSLANSLAVLLVRPSQLVRQDEVTMTSVLEVLQLLVKLVPKELPQFLLREGVVDAVHRLGTASGRRSRPQTSMKSRSSKAAAVPPPVIAAARRAWEASMAERYGPIDGTTASDINRASPTIAQLSGIASDLLTTGEARVAAIGRLQAMALRGGSVTSFELTASGLIKSLCHALDPSTWEGSLSELASIIFADKAAGERMVRALIKLIQEAVGLHFLTMSRATASAPSIAGSIYRSRSGRASTSAHSAAFALLGTPLRLRLVLEEDGVEPDASIRKLADMADLAEFNVKIDPMTTVEAIEAYVLSRLQEHVSELFYADDEDAAVSRGSPSDRELRALLLDDEADFDGAGSDADAGGPAKRPREPESSRRTRSPAASDRRAQPKKRRRASVRTSRPRRESKVGVATEAGSGGAGASGTDRKPPRANRAGRARRSARARASRMTTDQTSEGDVSPKSAKAKESLRASTVLPDDSASPRGFQAADRDTAVGGATEAERIRSLLAAGIVLRFGEDRVPQSSWTVIQALARCGVATRDCWSRTHTFKYRLRFGRTLVPSSKRSVACPTFDEEIVSAASDLLACLRGLQRVVSFNENQRIVRACESGETSAVGSQLMSSAGEHGFVNRAVASQVAHILEDPLVLCSGAVPGWPRLLCERMPSILPIESRCLLLAAGAGSQGRLVLMLHARHASGHLKRLPAAVADSMPKKMKFLVRRGRSLEAMVQALLADEGSNFAFDANYEGEVGVGSGPTREFFSEACKEIASRPRGVWRHQQVSKTTSTGDSVRRTRSRGSDVFRRVRLRHCGACYFLHADSDSNCRRGAGSGAIASARDDDASVGGTGACDAGGGTRACRQCGDIDHVSNVSWLMRAESLKELSESIKGGESLHLHRYSFAHCPHCEVTECWAQTRPGFHHSRTSQKFRHASLTCANAVLKLVRVLLHRMAVSEVERAVLKSPVEELKDEQAIWWANMPPLRDAAEHDEDALVLHPKPLSPETPTAESTTYRSFFSFLGRLSAYAIVDNRLLDLPLSIPFLRAIQRVGSGADTLGANGIVDDFRDILEVDFRLGQTLVKLQHLAEQRIAIENDPTVSPETAEAAIADLTYDGASVEDLCLDFTLPGAEDVQLTNNSSEGGEGGADTAVTIQNLESYVSAVLDSLLRTSIAVAAIAFREGVATVFDPGLLNLFSPRELQVLLCGHSNSGADEAWNVATMLAAFRCEHGYTQSSRAVQLLAEVCAEFTPAMRRQFLLFVTGSPRLPVGGFAALQPRLTVVQKVVPSSEGDKADSYLPSASTCHNYLKLPNYTSKEVMRDRITWACTEGVGGFHLS